MNRGIVTRRSFLGIGVLGVAAALGGCSSASDLAGADAPIESVEDDTADEGTQIQEDDAARLGDDDGESDVEQGAYVGSFDYVDSDGYSYRIDCALSPSISTDPADGKPGYVGVYMDFTDCSVTLTNTTSGKRAPGVSLSLHPIYPSDMEGMMGENNKSGSVRKFAGPDGVEYVDPISNIVDPNTYAVMEIYVGEPYNNYGASGIAAGDELQPNESRELAVRAGHTYNDVEPSVRMPDILEEYADAVKTPSGWAFTTARGEDIGFVMA